MSVSLHTIVSAKQPDAQDIIDKLNKLLPKLSGLRDAFCLGKVESPEIVTTVVGSVLDQIKRLSQVVQ